MLTDARVLPRRAPVPPDGAGPGPAPAPPPERPPPLPPWFVVPVGVLVCGVWGGSVWLSAHVQPDPLLHDVALFGHLAALVAGFGAVLVLDWLGFLWLLGRRTFADVTRTADAVHVLIWASLAGLTASGALLHPDPGSAWTQVKLALVLVLALNGLHAHWLQPRLAAYGLTRPPAGLLARATVTAAVSQGCWWAAMVIGFRNSQK